MRTLKVINQDLNSRIVSLIRHGQATSRGVLADVLNTSPSTMGLYVDDLIARGFLEESGLEQKGVGRPKRLLRILPHSGWFAGIEFTVGRLRALRLDFAGNPVEGHVWSIPEDIHKKQLLRRICEAVDLLRQGAAGPLLGVGAGSPGFVDPDNGRVIYSQFSIDWKQVPLAEILTSEFSVPASVNNNLNAIATAERWFGAGQEMDDFAVIRARNSFGMALIKDRALLPATHHAAGEIGMWPWTSQGGGVGQLQQVLSARAVWLRLTGEKTAPEDLREAFLQLADSSATAGPLWESVIDDFAKALGMVQLIVDSGAFLLHGPLTNLGIRFCDEINARAGVLLPALEHSPINLRPTSLGPDAGALGAAAFAMEAWNIQ